MDALPHLPRGHRAAALLPAVTPRPHPVLRPPRVDVGRGLGADVRVRLHRRLRIRGLLDHDVLRPRKQVGRSAVYAGAHVPPMPVLLGRRSGHHGGDDTGEEADLHCVLLRAICGCTSRVGEPERHWDNCRPLRSREHDLVRCL